MNMPFLSVVSTSLKSGICGDVVVTVTPGIGLPSGSRTLPMSLATRSAKASPGTVQIRSRSHASVCCLVRIVIPSLLFEVDLWWRPWRCRAVETQSLSRSR